MEQRPKKLMERVQDVIRLKHYSYQTEKTYVHWIKRYIFFHNKQHTVAAIAFYFSKKFSL